MIKLKSVAKRNPKAVEEPPKFYASAVHDASVELDGLATAVSNRCSLRRSDVHGVLIALMDIIPEELLNGKIVSLGNLGSFCVNVKSEGADIEEELSHSNVKGFKILYRPASKLKKLLRMTEVSFAQ